ncbi:MAG: hypothetical protein ABH858_06390 [Candidatus Omnitrophota bacterium]
MFPFVFHQEANAQESLYQTAFPYTKYFLDRALNETSEFPGLTRSFQLDLGGHGSDELAEIENVASAYDQTILGRICLSQGITTILDTYVNYYRQLSNPYNPLIDCAGNYYDGNGVAIRYGPYWKIRILGRDVPSWWDAWDWRIDTGGAACLIMYALEAYQKTQKEDYKNLAVLFAGYILKVEDRENGGIRFGPRGMYHYPEGHGDFYWNLKSTEQNERALCALKMLYEITSDKKYREAAQRVKEWLKSMYDTSVHLYHTAAEFIDEQWEKIGFGYVATDVVAFAPLEMMFSDQYFGVTQEERDVEVDAMFAAIEERTAFLNQDERPVFFRFSISQDNDYYGSVEFSSQMALAYLRVARIYTEREMEDKTNEYLDKYNALIQSLENYFVIPSGDSQAKVAPYASYLNGSVAGHVSTGTGYDTYNCQAALASLYFVFAKAGYDPTKLGGGQGGYNLHLLGVPGYLNHQGDKKYSGVAVSDMIIDFLDEQNTDSQEDLMYYADIDQDRETSVSEIERLLNDKSSSIYNFASAQLLQNYSDSGIIDSFSFDASDQDDCLKQVAHWLAYEVPGAPEGKENVPVAVCTSSNPAVGADSDYQHWMSIVGVHTNEDPSPDLENPFYTPESLELYGVYINDPGSEGVGFHSYVSAEEWRDWYFKPLASGLEAEGKYGIVMEPPTDGAKAVTITASQENEQTRLLLQTPKNEVSIYIPGWVNSRAKAYFMEMLKGLEQSKDFTFLLDDPYFGQALKDTYLRRCYKVDGNQHDDYTIVPFEKTVDGKEITTAVMLINNETGQFKMGFADQEADRVYYPLSYWQAYKSLREEIGWAGGEYPIGSYLVNTEGSSLYPERNITTVSYESKKTVMTLRVNQYNVTAQGKVDKAGGSPKINIVYNSCFSYWNRRDYLRIVVFDIDSSEECTGEFYGAYGCRNRYFRCKNNRGIIVLEGKKARSCFIKIKGKDTGGDIRSGEVTYLYIRI